ncbi:MAG: ABC-2 family transporter protein [Pirellulaceae bacterium]|nr:ABC-2 family transporter protein [Pirellulaceae bacterium]
MKHPSYLKVWLTFARNSLIREMTFRTNFFLDCLSSTCWTLMNIGFYVLIFQHTDSIGLESGWRKPEFFIFLGTTWIINAIIQAFLMPNAEEFSELIRTGGLDFALLKPIDTQFLVSFRKIHWSALSNLVVGCMLLAYALQTLPWRSSPEWHFSWYTVPLYLLFVGCGVVMLYSLMMCLAATSIWLGRNQSLYDFWFYITNFSRYPSDIYRPGWGLPLWTVFTFIIPVLVVINVPARVLAQPVVPMANQDWWIACFAIVATVIAWFASRWVFKRALLSYRSASS